MRLSRSTKMADSFISNARKEFLENILEGLLFVNEDGVASNADKHSKLSVNISKGICDLIQAEVRERHVGQAAGKKFEDITAAFLKKTFPRLSHIRPGSWDIHAVGARNRRSIADFEQYAHLTILDEASKANPELAAALGSDYTITPDVVVVRNLVEEFTLNDGCEIADEYSARKTSLRRDNGGLPLLHASISTKWTMRSDRSQNSRTEAQNLIRNRKGRAPHIVVVTGEPLPSRISSIALGTGDIDCVYHFALNELIESVKRCGDEGSISLLDVMTRGKRLKDISDLPFDLAC
jgi:hypothetical protein